MFRFLLLAVCLPALAPAQVGSLIPGEPLDCFSRSEGSVSASMVTVDGMPFRTALRLQTGDLSSTADPWSVRRRCFATASANRDDTVLATFWMRAPSGPEGNGFTTFVLERNDSPYTKSVSYTVAAGPEWKQVQIPFSMAETYAAGAYNFSFWVTFPNQVVEIGGLTVNNHGNKVPFASLGLKAWPYEGRAADAPWRAAAAARIEKHRKTDIVVTVRGADGKPVPNAPVRVRMKRHAFGFGTAVAGDALSRNDADGQNYRENLTRLFNKVVTENALKWPFWEAAWGREQAAYMLPWFAANGFTMVRGHNVIWPGKDNLPEDVRAMLNAPVVDKEKLRARINAHIAEVVNYARGKVSEWDVINEPYTNKDIMRVLGDAEMAEWFKRTREADPNARLYVNDYDIVAAGGYNLAHIDGYYEIIRGLLANGAPLDGIGMQGHFDSNLTSPERALEIFDKFAAFGKDLQITEFDVNIADEQVQADFTRDFLTMCFSHPAMKGFMLWGFWEGAHWLPRGAMFTRDWRPKPNLAVWNDLIFHQWWTNAEGITGADGTFRTRGFLGEYEIEAGGSTITATASDAGNTRFVNIGPAPASAITAVTNGASFKTGPVAPGEIVTIWGTGFGPSSIAVASYDDNGRLPASVGNTRVLFNGVAAAMVHSVAGQVTAIAPYQLSGSAVSVEVEYQGARTPAVETPVAASAPGIFQCDGQNAVVVNYTPAGPLVSCLAGYQPIRAGSVISLFVTGEGALEGAEYGRMPTHPAPVPRTPVRVRFGNIEAQPCPYSWQGQIYPGVLQINACVPEGIPGGDAVPVTVVAGDATSVPAATRVDPWRLVWSDEFDGPAGAKPDATKWTYDLGAGGWGNAELETYTSEAENASLDGSGLLLIRALQKGPGAYTSARLKTQHRFEFQYGRVEARIRIPFGQGIWPAFWMLGSNIDEVSWPACGEIDIMENIGKEPATVYATVHVPNPAAPNISFSLGSKRNVASGRLADDFHVYSVEWSENSLVFRLDGSAYFEATPGWLPNWPFRHPFFMLLNVAVGGRWPGYPDSSTTFPQTMAVDWVRVWQK